MRIQRSNMISTTFRVWWSWGSKGVKGTDQKPVCGGGHTALVLLIFRNSTERHVGEADDCPHFMTTDRLGQASHVFHLVS